ncbi:hypothetical protein [Rhizobium sp. G21]|uniref:hypothetical protein n=1 Tax=Rhizobium sp. G21 TaxID=2758439 RepID=UPI001FF0713C|nr:hypothetical protein [Rhizobium sp. G21]
MNSLRIFFTVFAVFVMSSSVGAIEGQRQVFPALSGQEGARLVIHAATDLEAMRPLILDFQETAPDLAVDVTDYVTNDLFREAQKACADGGEAVISCCRRRSISW